MRKKDSEFRIYGFILNDLANLGWDTRNPARNVNGQVYTQQECLSDERIAKQWGKNRPENTVKLSENTFYIIEAKPERENIQKALQGAEKYANTLNKSRAIKSFIFSGVAGDEISGYLIKSKFLERGKWKTIKINGRELSGFVSPEIVNRLMEDKKAEIEEIPIDEKVFLEKAEKINNILHEASINKDYRARVMAALLLALAENTPLNLDEKPKLLIDSINSRANALLQKEGKPNFYPFIAIDLPTSIENHNKFKKALVLTIQELLKLNIHSAMNSGTDVLGKFYEVFLKYGNGAKEIGIVLTPRHITKFACEVLDVNINDIIFDPTCGTGGFLVAAFDYVKTKAKNEEEINNFKQNNIFGIENQDGIVSLAIVNMIFRGDGKNNIIQGDCFQKWLNLTRKGNYNTAEYLEKDITNRIPPISKILMNPPFALKSSDDKEYKFIDHALKQMQNGGLLFSVFPNSNMVKQGSYLLWRKDSLLKNNTLLVVITFPKDLFYPIGSQTCGIIVKKGIPHKENQNVLWLKIKSDGLLKNKGKRLPDKKERNELEEQKNIIKQFVKNQNIKISDIKEFQKICPLDLNDKNLELLPEVYLDEKMPDAEELKKRVGEYIKEIIALMVRYEKIGDFRKEVLNRTKNLFSPPKKVKSVKFKEISITDLFKTPIRTGKYHKSKALDEGNIPLVSCVSENGGFEGFFDVEAKNVIKNAITIASDGMPLTSFYHFYPFTAKDNVLICIPKKNYRFTTLLFFVAQLNSLRWRFSYGRKCYENKVHKIKIFLPFKNGEINENYIETLFKQNKNWSLLKKITIL